MNTTTWRATSLAKRSGPIWHSNTLEPIVRSRPSCERTSPLAGIALNQLGRGRDAIALLTPFVHNHGGDPRGSFESGRARMSVGDRRAAVEAFTQCWRADPKFRGADAQFTTCRRKSRPR